MPNHNNIRNIPTENGVRVALTDWFERHGASVYWGEAVDEYDQETFEIRSTGVSRWANNPHRPDMLVDAADHVTIVEIKVGDEYGKIADGIYQTFDYWDKHHNGRLRYETDDDKYSPDSFVFATRYSPFGHIYPSKHEFYYSNGDMYAINEQLPQFEANMSGVSLRALWRFAQQAADGPSAGVGLVLSDTLEHIPEFESMADEFGMIRTSKTEQQGRPAVFYWEDGQEWITF